MEPRSELLVFNKKEIAVIITLLVLVALFSFTLGLKLGKTLGGGKSEHVETAPLTEKKAAVADHGAATDAAGHGDEHAAAPAADAPGEGHGAPAAEHGSMAEGHGSTPAEGETATKTPGKTAEDLADQELVSETGKEKVGLGKAVPMALPKEKKTEASQGGRFTLQVGSHRTVAEAAEQVTALKRLDLEAFYIEAKVRGKGTWYRVGVGTYVSKEAAEAAGAKLKATKSLPSFIVQRITE